MRPIVLSMCLLAAACGSQDLKSPLSPASMRAGAEAQSQAKGGTDLPFSGTVSGTTRAAFPAPGTLEITLNGGGHATHIGQFEMTAVATGTFPNRSRPGRGCSPPLMAIELTAEIEARGEPIGELTDRVTSVGKITGGTGRFASATGHFTAIFIAPRDESTGTGTFSGSFEGRLNLNQ